MSQDDQRNPRSEEPAEAVRPAAAEAAGVAEPSGVAEHVDIAETSGVAEPPDIGATEATATVPEAEAATTTTAPAAPPITPRREFHEPGDGASRYAATGEQTPSHGSEESWSAAPHPGYQVDPARHVTTRRLLVGGLVGLVVLGAGSFAGYSLLLAKSSNGNGAAPWTAAVKQDGAVVGGINAQNNGAATPVDLPAGAVFGNSGLESGAVINQAVDACRTATSTTVPVTSATGTGAQISTWSDHATATVTALHSAAGVLQRALTTKQVATVASAATALCDGYPAIAKVAPMPDAVGSHAWAAAVQAYALAATDSLRGVSGNPDALAAANDNIVTGNAQLVALQARIVSTT